MSTALAIASVTAVLKDLLVNGMIDHDLSSSVGDVLVSALPPDRIPTDAQNEQSQLNLFLYQVAPNPGWRNVALPSRNGQGERLTNPPLALDLHYLLTAYGAKDLHAEILLGYGMQLFHETPVLTRDAIRRALAPPSTIVTGGSLPSTMTALYESALDEQIEQIKITPTAMNAEEIFKLWSAFQTRYRPTAAYQASLVLIESRNTTRAALPVRERKLFVVPFQHPRIERLLSQENAAAPESALQPVLAGYNLIVVGTQLRGDDTTVSVGGVELAPPAADISPTRIRIQLPDALRAGVQGVQVVHRRLMGSPPEPRLAATSNLAAFVLRPAITSVAADNITGAGTGDEMRLSAIINLVVEPPVKSSQRVVLLLNEFAPEQGTTALAYSFNAPSGNTASPPDETANLSIPVSGMVAGKYLVRVLVDGAESPLVADANPPTPADAGRYFSPQVTIQ